MAVSQRNENHADIIVVGGGPAGCSMAALLGSHGIRVICVDQDDPVKSLRGEFDGRTTAISFGSRRVIEAAGAWEAMIQDACPIEDIKIMESGSPVLLEFLSQDVDSDAFGWIVENRLLRRSLYESLSNLETVRHVAPAKVLDYALDSTGVDVHLQDGRTLRAALVIGADGRKSFTRDWMGIDTRGWTYHQRALVCIAVHENGHNNTAIEDFRAEGPFAILPMTDDEQGRHRSSIVWTEHGPEKDSALYWDDETFAAALTERFPDFYGEVTPLGKRFSYPLGLTHAQSYIAPRMALVADAAHGIHPIAGQGLNLGLRDVAALAEILIDAWKKGQDLGDVELLESYQSQRRLDNMMMAGATDILNGLFSNNVTPLRIARTIGLRAIQKINPAKRFFMKQAMGSAGLLPALIRDGKF